MCAVLDTHRRFMDLSMVYTNDPVWAERSIHIMELLLAEEKYKVVGLDLEYTHQDVRAPPCPHLPLLPGYKALRAHR